MVALNSQEKQVVELFRRLDPSRRRHVLLEMAKSAPDAWKGFRRQAEPRLRELARAKGFDWEQMDDQQRQDLVEQIDGDNP